MIRRCILTLTIALLLPGCGGPGGRSFTVDLAEARRAGAVASAITQAELGRVELPALSEYLEGLVASLSAQLPGPKVAWRVAVLDTAQPLIVGFEGGHLLVSRGLLVDVEDEPALLRVLATEMAHVALGHAVTRLERLAKQAARGAPGAAEGLVLPGLGRPLGSVGSILSSLTAIPYDGEQRAAIVPVVARVLAARAAWESPLAFPRPLAGLAVGQDPRQGVVEGSTLRHRGLGFEVDFPTGWEILNAADFAAAFAPDGTARVVIQLLGEDGDPLTLARRFAQGGGARFGLLPRLREIGGRDAARAFGSTEDASLDISWLVHAGQQVQITGVCRPEDYDRLQVAFIDVALSLRTPDKSHPELLPELLHVEQSSDGRWLRIPRRAPLSPTPAAHTALEPRP